MDPILASTSEFNKFLKDKLTPHSQNEKAKSRSTTTHSSRKPQTEPDLDLNIAGKFVSPSAKSSAKSSVSTSTNVRDSKGFHDRSAPAIVSDNVRIEHSWRAHLPPPKTPIIAVTAEAKRTSTSTTTLGYIDQHREFKHSSVHDAKDGADSGFKSELGTLASARSRMNQTLQKHLSAWRAVAVSQASELRRLSDRVRAAAASRSLTAAWQSWLALWKGAYISMEANRRHMRTFLLTWHQVWRACSKRDARMDKHFRFFAKWRGLQALRVFLRTANIAKNRLQRVKMGSYFRRLGLLKRMFLPWKKLIRFMRSQRELDEGAQARKLKIHLAMEKLKIGSASSVEEKDADHKASLSGEASVAARGFNRVGSSTTRSAPTGVSNTVGANPTTRGSGLKMGARAGPATGPKTASGPGATVAPLHRPKLGIESRTAQSKPPLPQSRSSSSSGGRGSEEKQAKQAWSDSPQTETPAPPLGAALVGDQHYEDDYDSYSGSDEDSRPPPPPAYRQESALVSSSLLPVPHVALPSPRSNCSSSSSSSNSRNTGAVSQQVRSSSASRPVSASRTMQQSSSTAAPTGTLAATTGASPKTIAERAAERRNRVDLLNKQATERVTLKNKKLEEEKRIKEAAEEEQVQKLRAERRLEMERQRMESSVFKAQQAQLRSLLMLADKHRHKQLLVRFGFAPWRLLCEQARLFSDTALQFSVDWLKIRYWSKLIGFVVAQRTRRAREELRLSSAASAHYKRYLMALVFRRLTKFKKLLRAKSTAVSVHFAKFAPLRRSFLGWKIALEGSKRRAAVKMRAVCGRGDRCVMRFYWRIWAAFLAECQFEREVQRRADRAWSKVQSWLK